MFHALHAGATRGHKLQASRPRLHSSPRHVGCVLRRDAIRVALMRMAEGGASIRFVHVCCRQSAAAAWHAHSASYRHALLLRAAAKEREQLPAARLRQQEVLDSIAPEAPMRHAILSYLPPPAVACRRTLPGLCIC